MIILTLVSIPDGTDHMTLKDFKDGCKANGFTDDDGIGYLATKNQMSNIVVSPVDFAKDNECCDMRYTHVVWFNK